MDDLCLSVSAVYRIIIAVRRSPDGDVGFAVLVIISRDGFIAVQAELPDQRLPVGSSQNVPDAGARAKNCRIAARIAVEIAVNRNIAV